MTICHNGFTVHRPSIANSIQIPLPFGQTLSMRNNVLRDRRRRKSSRQKLCKSSTIMFTFTFTYLNRAKRLVPLTCYIFATEHSVFGCVSHSVGMTIAVFHCSQTSRINARESGLVLGLLCSLYQMPIILQEQPTSRRYPVTLL